MLPHEETIVLVLEKKRGFAGELDRQLPSDRFQVLAAASAPEGKRLLDDFRAEIVVLDPLAADGIELLRYARSTDFPSVVIGVTPRPELAQSLRSAGIESIVGESQASHTLAEAVLACARSIDADAGRKAPLVLVVDDDPETIAFLSRMLDAWGFSVLTAMDGVEALRHLAKNPAIALVLLDMKLPGCSGLDILQKMMTRKPGLNVIMISAVADREIARNAVKIGAVDFLPKPLELSSLKSEIMASLSQSGYRNPARWKRFGG
jgi:DNA-binding response OmpR family regulator